MVSFPHRRAEPSRPTARSRRGRLRAGVVAALVAVGLTGCGSSVTGGWTESGAEAGYVSGDLSVTTWPEPERTGPVEIVGTDFAGEPVDLRTWRGDVVVLNTWYAACPPCRAEAPDLVALAEDYADDGVHVLGINSRDEAGAAQAFEREFGVPYPSVQDTSSEAVAALQGKVAVNAVPTTILLDRQGNVAARILGVANPTTLRALVEDLLDEAA